MRAAIVIRFEAVDDESTKKLLDAFKETLQTKTSLDHLHPQAIMLIRESLDSLNEMLTELKFPPTD